MRWNRIAIIALGIPVLACLVALASSTESPVYLVAQNKVLCYKQIVKLGLCVAISRFILKEKKLNLTQEFYYLQIEEAKRSLTRLYGPNYKVPEEVEIIRLNLQRRSEAASGNNN